MKVLKKLLLVVIAIVTALGFYACDDSDGNVSLFNGKNSSSIVGTWSLYEIDIDGVDYDDIDFDICTFKYDGTYKWTSSIMGIVWKDESGTWVYDSENHKLITTRRDEQGSAISSTYTVIFDGNNKMTLIDKYESFTYIRQ